MEKSQIKGIESIYLNSGEGFGVMMHGKIPTKGN